MPENKYIITSGGELIHYGVKGMKWGVRRYRNPDGSYTPAGLRRNYKIVKEYAKADSGNHLKKNYQRRKDDMHEFAKDAVGKGLDAVNRTMEAHAEAAKYSKAYNKEYSRLTQQYMKQNKNPHIVDSGDIPLSDRRRLVKEASMKTGYDPRKAQRLYKKTLRLMNEDREECRKLANKLLGKYGNRVVSSGRSLELASTKLSEELRRASRHKWNLENDPGYQGRY